MTFNTDIELAKYIQSLGGELWLVGGSVRDELMGKPSKDNDYTITGLDPSDLPFEDKVVGNDFPVFLVNIGGKTCEIALARLERKTRPGYHGFDVMANKDVTIEDDLRRRDLTINSIAKNVLTGEIVDPYDGSRDIGQKTLKHTSEAFVEDPLRALRVARFAARMGDFKVADETIELLRTMREELAAVEPSRLWKELEESLKGAKPSTFFRVLKEADLLDVWFPEIAAMDVPDRHDGTVFEHVMRVMDAGTTPKERFGLLCHDLGKPLTPQEDFPAHFGHDKLGDKPILDMCARIRVPNEYRDFGLLCAREHMRAHRLSDMRSGKLIKWVLDNKKDIDSLMNVVKIDGAYREGVDRQEAIEAWNSLRDLVDLALSSEKEITGKDLIAAGYDPKEGKRFGDILRQKRIELLKKKRSEP